MATASCRKSPGNRKEYTKWAPALCTTICRSLSSANGFRNWGHAGEMMILAGAITDLPMLDGICSEPRPHAWRRLCARHDRDSESRIPGEPDAQAPLSLCRALASVQLSPTFRR